MATTKTTKATATIAEDDRTMPLENTFARVTTDLMGFPSALIFDNPFDLDDMQVDSRVWFVVQRGTKFRSVYAGRVVAGRWCPDDGFRTDNSKTIAVSSLSDLMFGMTRKPANNESLRTIISIIDREMKKIARDDDRDRRDRIAAKSEKSREVKRLAMLEAIDTIAQDLA